MFKINILILKLSFELERCLLHLKSLKLIFFKIVLFTILSLLVLRAEFKPLDFVMICWEFYYCATTARLWKDRCLRYDFSSGLYYKSMTIVNDDFPETLLSDDARVVIYDRHMFIVQDTEHSLLRTHVSSNISFEASSKRDKFWSLPKKYTWQYLATLTIDLKEYI